MSNRGVRRILWWVCLVVAPLILATIELFHPAGFTNDPGMYAYLSKPEPYQPQYHALAYFGPHWWFALHMIQTPLVALVAVGLWQMMRLVGDGDGVAVMLAWLSRLATFVFLIYYTALDSIGGSGLGRSILATQRLAAEGSLTPEDVQKVALVLDTTWVDRWVGGVGSVISLTGSWAVFTAALLGALALWRTKRLSWIPLVLLVGFGWELQLSHTMPHGPIAFLLLAVVAVWIWRAGEVELVG